MEKAKVLVGTGSRFGRNEAEELGKYAQVYYLGELVGDELEAILPEIECVFTVSWPAALDAGRISRMKSLRFVQSESAGVNTIPFRELGEDVVVCSNAGGYSQGVGEYAIGLMMVAAKRIMRLDRMVRGGEIGKAARGGLSGSIMVLEGKKLGILGYGGIGRAVAKIAYGLGMEICAYSREAVNEPGVRSFCGEKGLDQVLGESDAVVIALPLTKLTAGLIDGRRLGLMKPNCVMVNVGRGDIVVEKDLYEHLTQNREFFYATDVWWSRDGKESFSPDSGILGLENFIGVPHISGPSAHSTGEPARLAVGNLVRFLKGEKVGNIVRRSDYV